MGQAGTELRGQECREGRLLPRLATRSQELGHLSRGGGEWPSSTRQSKGVPRGGGAQTAEVSTSSQSPSGSSSSSLGGRRQMKSREADGGAKTHTHRQRVHIAERQRETPRQCGQGPHNGERQDAFFSLSLPFHMENRPTAVIQKYIHTHTHPHTHTQGVKHLL